MAGEFRENPLRALGYFIASTAFILSIVFPLVFKYTTMYAAPTAVYALQIARTGSLNAQINVLENSYWHDTILMEANFPVPSILLSIILEVAGIPVNYVMFLTITALTQISFFALARRILFTGKTSNAVFLAALAYAYLACINITVGYTARGSIGVAMLTNFMLAYTLFLRNQLKKPGNLRRWMAVLMLLTLATGYTYYFSLLGIFISTALMFLFVGTLALFSKHHVFRPSVLPVTLLSVALLIYGPFMNTVTSMAGALTLTSFVGNVLLYFKVLLRFEAPQEILLQRGLVQTDLLTTVTGYWLLHAVQILSVFAVIYGLIAYRPRKGQKTQLIWLFCLAILFLSFAELPYLFVTVAAPIRFISIYGSIAFLFLVGKLAPTRTTDSFVNHWKKAHFAARTSAVCLLLVILISASFGSFRNDWYYGVREALCTGQSRTGGEFSACTLNDHYTRTSCRRCRLRCQSFLYRIRQFREC